LLGFSSSSCSQVSNFLIVTAISFVTAKWIQPVRCIQNRI
jgi:hypothetical protein